MKQIIHFKERYIYENTVLDHNLQNDISQYVTHIIEDY